MRLDRPIGTWLLFWPCVFGLMLGATSGDRPFSSLHDWWLIVLFGIGAVVMRGAGCTYNDIVDRDIDARVARTRGRPIPSGAVSVKQAWLFLVGLSVSWDSLILLQLNTYSIVLGVASLVAGRGLSIHEAHHLVAAGLARPHLQLGRPARFRRRDRRHRSRRRDALCGAVLLDARLRHDLRPSGQGGRRADRREIDRASAWREVADGGFWLSMPGRSH